jgi:hypothetical protein
MLLHQVDTVDFQHPVYILDYMIFPWDIHHKNNHNRALLEQSDYYGPHLSYKLTFNNADIFRNSD